MTDHIRDTIAARAKNLGLSAYAIAKRCEMSPEAVKRYLTCRCSLNTRYVSAICEVLGLELRLAKKKTNAITLFRPKG